MSIRTKYIPLPPAVESAYLALFKPIRDARAREDWDEVERLMLEAWALIPEPKLGHDRAASTVNAIVQHYRDVGRHGEAKHWLEILRQAYPPGERASDTHFATMAGTVAFVAGELDEAYRVFDGLYSEYGRRPFEGLDPKYLRFYLDRKKGAPKKAN